MTTVGEVTESREDIPLKKGKKPKWYHCNEDSFSGSKYINIAFGSLTVIITVALVIQIYYGDYQVVPHGSVATDSLDCSNVGTSILKRGGNAIDAAIASALCLAVAVPHVTGLDANGQMLIYSHRTRSLPDVIDFNDIQVSESMPRLVLGLIYAYQKYGSLTWKELVQPAVDLARNGYLVSKMLVQAVTKARAEDIFGRLEPGQLLQHENLALTLEQIANISKEDLYSYFNENNPNITQALRFTFHDYDVYVPGGPTMGPLLIENLQDIEQYNFTRDDILLPEYTYRLAESTQITHNKQNVSTTFHVGTFSNVAVIDTLDNYVSLAMGMTKPFGSGEMTAHGYILDIKSPNFPHCTRLPIIVIDANFICGRRLVFGANDLAVATQIIAALAIADENTTEIVESPRFHIVDDTHIGVEDFHLPAFGSDTLSYLESLTPQLVKVPEPYQSCNIVEKVKDNLKSHSDSRGGGIASRY